MNIIVPVMAAHPYAIHVYGSTSADSLETAVSREVRPSRRRSTMRIEPKTTANEITCRVSILGNSHSQPFSPRTAAARGMASIRDSISSIVIAQISGARLGRGQTYNDHV